MNEKSMNAPQGAKSSSMTSSGMIIAVVAIIIIVGAGLLYLKNRLAAGLPVNNQPVASQNSNQPGNGGNNQASVTTETTIKSFDLTAAPFKFSLTEIRVKKGDRVRINLTNLEGLHDWVIDQFNAKTKQLLAGQSDSVEFIASQAGTFEYYCSVGTHRQMGMVGKLIVSD